MDWLLAKTSPKLYTRLVLYYVLTGRGETGRGLAAGRDLRIGPDSVLHASHVERRLADRSIRRTTVVKNANNGHARRVISGLSTAIGLRRLNLQNSGTYTHLSAQVATVVTRPTTTPDTAASSDSASGARGPETTGLRDRDINLGAKRAGLHLKENIELSEEPENALPEAVKLDLIHWRLSTWTSACPDGLQPLEAV